MPSRPAHAQGSRTTGAADKRTAAYENIFGRPPAPKPSPGPGPGSGPRPSPSPHAAPGLPPAMGYRPAAGGYPPMSPPHAPLRMGPGSLHGHGPAPGLPPPPPPAPPGFVPGPHGPGLGARPPLVVPMPPPPPPPGPGMYAPPHHPSHAPPRLNNSLAHHPSARSQHPPQAAAAAAGGGGFFPTQLNPFKPPFSAPAEGGPPYPPAPTNACRPPSNPIPASSPRGSFSSQAAHSNSSSSSAGIGSHPMGSSFGGRPAGPQAPGIPPSHFGPPYHPGHHHTTHPSSPTSSLAPSSLPPPYPSFPADPPLRHQALTDVLGSVGDPPLMPPDPVSSPQENLAELEDAYDGISLSAGTSSSTALSQIPSSLLITPDPSRRSHSSGSSPTQLISEPKPRPQQQQQTSAGMSLPLAPSPPIGMQDDVRSQVMAQRMAIVASQGQSTARNGATPQRSDSLSSFSPSLYRTDTTSSSSPVTPHIPVPAGPAGYDSTSPQAASSQTHGWQHSQHPDWRQETLNTSATSSHRGVTSESTSEIHQTFPEPPFPARPSHAAAEGGSGSSAPTSASIALREAQPASPQVTRLSSRRGLALQSTDSVDTPSSDQQSRVHPSLRSDSIRAAHESSSSLTDGFGPVASPHADRSPLRLHEPDTAPQVHQQLLSVLNPALLSRVARAMEARLPVRERSKDGLSYKDAFDGSEAVDLLVRLIGLDPSSPQDYQEREATKKGSSHRNLALLLGRTLEQNKLFHHVTYDLRLRDSGSELYQFRRRMPGSGRGEHIPRRGLHHLDGLELGSMDEDADADEEDADDDFHPGSADPDVDVGVRGSRGGREHGQESLLDEEAENDAVAVVGVFTPLSKCYSPTCSDENICYSLSCPRRRAQHLRREQHQRQHATASGRRGLSSSDSENIVTAMWEARADGALVVASGSLALSQSGEAAQGVGDGPAGDEDEDARLTAPGALWADKVSKEVLESVDSKERKRQELINEVVNTECDFVHDLEYLRDRWMNPLRTRPGVIEPERRKGEFVRQVFWNAEEILSTNKPLADALVRRQKQEDVVKQIGDVFLSHVPYFSPFVRYGAHQLYGKYEFEKEKADNPNFVAFVDEVERLPESRKLELNGYLTKPTTRLARYPLLLEQVIKYTKDGESDKETLPEVIKMVKDFLSQVNEETGKSENRFQVTTLADQLIFKPGEETDLRLREEGREMVFKGPLKRRGGSGQGETAELQAYLFDHVFVLVKPKVVHKVEILRVNRKPIPLELLVCTIYEDIPAPTGSKPSGKLKSLTTRMSTGNRLTSVLAPGAGPRQDSKSGYALRLTFLGRRGYSMTLWASTYVGRQKWFEHVDDAQGKLRNRSNIFETMSIGPLADFASSREHDSHNKNHHSLPIDDHDVRPTCCVPFDFGRRVIYGTNNGVYLSELRKGARPPTKVLPLSEVTQIDVLEEYQVLLVLSDKTLWTFTLDALNPSNSDASLRAGRRIQGTVHFFCVGSVNNKTLVCAVKSSTVSSTIRLFEPLDAKQRTQGAKRPGLQWSNSSHKGQDALRIFKDFYVSTESSGAVFLKNRLCLTCAKGFEIVDIDTLDTQGILDATDPKLEFLTNNKEVTARPSAIFLIHAEFLLCYDEFAFYVNRFGRRSRPDWLISWEGHPTSFALSYPYLLAFDSSFVEIRHVASGALHQILTGSRLGCLFSDPSPHVPSKKELQLQLQQQQQQQLQHQQQQQQQQRDPAQPQPVHPHAQQRTIGAGIGVGGGAAPAAGGPMMAGNGGLPGWFSGPPSRQGAPGIASSPSTPMMLNPGSSPGLGPYRAGPGPVSSRPGFFPTSMPGMPPPGPALAGPHRFPNGGMAQPPQQPNQISMMPFAFSQAHVPTAKPASAAHSPMWESAFTSRHNIVLQGDNSLHILRPGPAANGAGVPLQLAQHSGPLATNTRPHSGQDSGSVPRMAPRPPPSPAPSMRSLAAPPSPQMGSMNMQPLRSPSLHSVSVKVSPGVGPVRVAGGPGPTGALGPGPGPSPGPSPGPGPPIPPGVQGHFSPGLNAQHVAGRTMPHSSPMPIVIPGAPPPPPATAQPIMTGTPGTPPPPPPPGMMHPHRNVFFGRGFPGAPPLPPGVPLGSGSTRRAHSPMPGVGPARHTPAYHPDFPPPPPGASQGFSPTTQAVRYQGAFPPPLAQPIPRRPGSPNGLHPAA